MMNYFDRLDLGYTKEEALEIDRLILENRMDELERKSVKEGLTDREKTELNELFEFFDNYYGVK